MANSKLTLSKNAMLNLDFNNNCVSHLLFAPQAWFSKLLFIAGDLSLLFSNFWKAPATGENTGEWVEENNATCSESSMGVEMRSLACPNLFARGLSCLPLLRCGVQACTAIWGVVWTCKTSLGGGRGDCREGSWRKHCSIMSTSDNPAASNSKPNDKLKEALGDWLT